MRDVHEGQEAGGRQFAPRGDRGRATAQFAGRMTGLSGVSGPGGDVTGVGGAAIVRRRLLRVEESALGPDEAGMLSVVTGSLLLR